MVDEQEVERAWIEFRKSINNAPSSEERMKLAFKAGYDDGYKKADTESAERDAGASL
jgi:hypothetical protein